MRKRVLLVGSSPLNNRASSDPSAATLALNGRGSRNAPRIGPHANGAPGRRRLRKRFDDGIRVGHLAPLQNHDLCHGAKGTANTPTEFSPKNKLFSVAFEGG